MEWWQAIILGIVEGVTEYLPVSSTGHLLVTQWLLGIGQESDEAKAAADAYAICIQGGAILAVLGLYWSRVRQGFRGIFGKCCLMPQDDDGWRLFVNLCVAFVPAAIIGKCFDDKIEALLMNSWTVVVMWAVGGVAILGVSYWRCKRLPQGESVEDAAEESAPEPSAQLEAQASVKGNWDLVQLTWKMALVIGLLQCVAMVPGTSRSLMTIVAGVLVGLSLSAAVEFSFLLGVITLGAATVYKGIDAGPLMLQYYGWGPLVWGVLASFLSAVLAIKWLVNFLKRHGMTPFGWYRIAIALVVGCMLLAGYDALG